MNMDVEPNIPVMGFEVEVDDGNPSALAVDVDGRVVLALVLALLVVVVGVVLLLVAAAVPNPVEVEVKAEEVCPNPVVVVEDPKMEEGVAEDPNAANPEVLLEPNIDVAGFIVAPPAIVLLGEVVTVSTVVVAGDEDSSFGSSERAFLATGRWSSSGEICC